MTNVGFSGIQTNAITVSWTTPENYKHFINNFMVTWRTITGTSNTGSKNLDNSKTSYTLTNGIDPGRAYTVTVTSVNTETEQGSQRTTSVVKEQAASKITFSLFHKNG